MSSAGKQVLNYTKRLFTQTKNLFCEHPGEANQSYLAHMGDSLKYSVMALGSSVTFFVHGFMPFCFKKTGGNIVNELNSEIEAKRCEISRIALERTNSQESARRTLYGDD